MKNIKLKMGATSIAITAVVIACVVFLNVIVGVLSERHPLKIDLTRDKVYEFSEQTKDVMKKLDSEVTAYAIVSDKTQNEYIEYVKEYLKKYKALSNKFNVKYVDPYEDTSFMNKYISSGQNVAEGAVVIECGDKFEVIEFYQMYSVGYTNDLQLDAEKKITNAIMKVTGLLKSANVYFTEGHNELPSTNLKDILTEEGYVCNQINLNTSEVPEDANVIVSMAPMVDFTEQEREALQKFLDNGGRFVLSLYPGVEKMERLDGYLAEWGIKLNYDSVVEADPNCITSINGIKVPVALMQSHDITEKLAGNKATLAMPSTMSLSVTKSKNGAEVASLLSTSEKAYGKTNLYSTNSHKEVGDIDGPLCLAAISERVENNIGSGVMVVGSALALETEVIMREGAYLNSDFALNSFSYISGVKTTGDIRAKRVSPELMDMTLKESTFVRDLTMKILPALIVLAGLVIWLRRRFK